MATIREVTMGRPGHYRYWPVCDRVSMLEWARCECGATWIHTHDPLSSFCEWADRHQAPSRGESR